MTGGKLFRNPGGASGGGGANHWLKIRLKGGGKVNGAAIGAQIRIRIDKRTFTRQVEGATGQGNQNDLVVHFGLGSHKEAVKLEIAWPDGHKQTVKDVKVDQILEVKR